MSSKTVTTNNKLDEDFVMNLNVCFFCDEKLAFQHQFLLINVLGHCLGSLSWVSVLGQCNVGIVF